MLAENCDFFMNVCSFNALAEGFALECVTAPGLRKTRMMELYSTESLLIILAVSIQCTNGLRAVKLIQNLLVILMVGAVC